MTNEYTISENFFVISDWLGQRDAVLGKNRYATMGGIDAPLQDQILYAEIFW